MSIVQFFDYWVCGGLSEFVTKRGGARCHACLDEHPIAAWEAKISEISEIKQPDSPKISVNIAFLFIF